MNSSADERMPSAFQSNRARRPHRHFPPLARAPALWGGKWRCGLALLRAWSRLAEELRAERVRLSNRVHHQLWRYYPQMQKLTNDLAAPWFLQHWAIAAIPAKASGLLKSTVQRLLKQQRIRPVDAETSLLYVRE